MHVIDQHMGFKIYSRCEQHFLACKRFEVTLDNLQTLLWTVFTGTTFYWGNIPMKAVDSMFCAVSRVTGTLFLESDIAVKCFKRNISVFTSFGLRWQKSQRLFYCNFGDLIFFFKQQQVISSFSRWYRIQITITPSPLPCMVLTWHLIFANHKCGTSTHLVHQHGSAILQSRRTEPRLRMVKDNTNRSPNYGELESERWGEESERGGLGIECWGGCL